MNQYLNTVIIAPLTSTLKNYPIRVAVFIQKKKGQIALDQIRTVVQTRLTGVMGALNKQTIVEVKEVLFKMFQ